MFNLDMMEVFTYALWCWGSYALIMGSFLVSLHQQNAPLTKSHVFVAMMFSAFGMYSFVFNVIRSMLMHGLLFPLSWRMSSGKVSN